MHNDCNDIDVMETMDNVSPLISEANSPEIANAYHNTFDSLNDKAKAMAHTAVDMFNSALNAYIGFNDKSKPTNARIFRAAAHAVSFKAQFDYFKELTGLDEEQTIAKIDSISKYLSDHKWITLPEYDDINGNHVVVMAGGMVNDMMNYLKAARRIHDSVDEVKDKSNKEAK